MTLSRFGLPLILFGPEAGHVGSARAITCLGMVLLFALASRNVAIDRHVQRRR